MAVYQDSNKVMAISYNLLIINNSVVVTELLKNSNTGPKGLPSANKIQCRFL